MASIERRQHDNGRTTYRVKVRLKGYPPQSTTFERLTDAKKWAQQTEAAIREGRHFRINEAKRHTLSELVDRYLKEVLPNKAKSTQATQTQQIKWWQSQIGDYLLADVTPPLIAEYRDVLLNEPGRYGRQRSSAIINRYLAVLSHAFTIAKKEWHWVTTNPALEVSRKKEPPGRVRFLSDDERERLLQACRESSNPNLYPAVVLALSTGARQMEIMALDWSQIDFERGFILLDDPDEIKNNERRALALVGYAYDLLKERNKVRRINTSLVFPSKKNPRNSP